MICVIFNQIYFDFERSDLFNKNAKLSHDEIKNASLEKKEQEPLSLEKKAARAAWEKNYQNDSEFSDFSVV